MTSPASSDRAEQQEIDASARWPVLAFLGKGLAWLVVGGLLQLAASIQLHTPGFLGALAGCEWFTHGRLAAAAENVLVYGWGFNAGLGVALWLMARLSAAALRHGGWLLVAGQAWNLAVGLGMLGIFVDGTTSYQLLEFPRWVTLLLLVSYALMGVWAITTFSVRNTENVYASQWYVFAAVLFFPWLYGVAQTMLFAFPAQGVVQAIVNAWYVNGLYSLWFTPLALAAAYYFLPKLTGRPIHDYYLAASGFWWLVVTGAFAGGARLIGGPLPSWVPTIGIVANFLLVVAVVIILTNLVGSLRGAGAALKGSVALRFIVLSIAAFALAALLNFALSIRDVAAMLQFTLVAELRDWTVLYACFSTAMFGAAYFIVPRLTGFAWRSSALVRAHWLGTLAGVALLVVALGYGGWQQGRLLNASTAPFAEIAAALRPWLVLRSVALMVLLTGHLAFALNFCWTACGALTRKGARAEFRAPPALADATAEGRA